MKTPGEANCRKSSRKCSEGRGIAAKYALRQGKKTYVGERECSSRKYPEIQNAMIAQPQIRRVGDRQSGQAAVEAALVLPLVVFAVVGTLQLFMLLQARVAAEYAVFRAVRAGSLSHGDCKAMTHAALVTLLPTLTRTDGPDAFVDAFARHRDNRYDVQATAHDGPIIELFREEPSNVPREDLAFDDPGRLVRIEARMLFWYRLKVPFADWVLGRMALAHFGLKEYVGPSPLMPVRDVRWTKASNLPEQAWPGGAVGARMRTWSERGQYVLPIIVNASMRMMTPARARNFQSQGCPL